VLQVNEGAGMITPSVSELEKMVIRWDRALRKDTKQRNVAVILLGSALGTFKQDAYDIEAQSGFNRNLIRETIANFRRNGIWKNGKVYTSGWEGENGGIGFALDIACGCGWIQRSTQKKRRRG
jgi:hypothetical protein